ncbi:hypothetical protein SAMN04488028_101203 [Reichenbachiella agariperforans]|uniref:DUF6989 domain-containing protein n=1 Tax=Reichenbachiella agariperforans TaxID=156994 RepID=A0A1M6JIC6_REIAG|nr:hypothetical protein [Reichenbachiella agariperforans]SHJ46393.1 hypothetical protein SAMN04488028_101203 [Reichenbachiella agariperforans]
MSTNMKANNYPGLDAKTTFLIISSSIILLVWSYGSSWVDLGPVTASIITYGLYMFYWGYTLLTKNYLIKRLIILGTIAGVLELVTDDYLVHTIHSLVYPKGEWMIWSSPAYMPFAWANVLVQLSFIGVLLTQKYNIWIASIVLCIAGGMYIPLYEHLASGAGWWWYNNNTAMILNAPIYVIVCEALISLSLPLIVWYAEQHILRRTVYLGIGLGVWIYVSAIVSYMIAR